MLRRVFPLILFLFAVLGLYDDAKGFEYEILPDSLYSTCERIVITHEELSMYNIHTLLDVIKFVPGVNFWIKGPDGAPAGISIEGGESRGFSLYLNGIPLVDRYTGMALVDFLPLSRIDYIEIIYGGPAVLSSQSSGGVINLVTYEGGLGGPRTDVEFTYGKSNRRARRAWFSTPDSYFNFTIAYDEYLHDAAEVHILDPTRKFGLYDMRSVLLDFLMKPGDRKRVFVRVHRFDKSYVGTPVSDIDEVIQNGMDSHIRLCNGPSSITISQGKLSSSLISGKISYRYVSAYMKHERYLGSLSTIFFLNASKVTFENDIWGKRFNPRISLFEGGVSVHSDLKGNLSLRTSIAGGSQNHIGSYLSGEAVVMKRWAFGVNQSISVARRVRVPSVEEFFQPEIERSIYGEYRASAGNSALDICSSNEYAMSFEVPSRGGVKIFGKEFSSVISLSDSVIPEYESVYGGWVSGVRGMYRMEFALLGVRFHSSYAVEVFTSRVNDIHGIPEYRVLSSIYFRTPAFKNTETLTLGMNAELVGSRRFYGRTLDKYLTIDLFGSLTIMSARVHFAIKNILGEKYQTYPNYLMPGRYVMVGLYWKLLD